jgi:hypothetical protein
MPANPTLFSNALFMVNPLFDINTDAHRRPAHLFATGVPHPEARNYWNFSLYAAESHTFSCRDE